MVDESKAGQERPFLTGKRRQALNLLAAPKERKVLYRDNNVLYHTIIFCTIQYCSVLHEYLQQEATQSDLPIFLPVFPLGKRGASISKKLW